MPLNERRGIQEPVMRFLENRHHSMRARKFGIKVAKPKDVYSRTEVTQEKEEEFRYRGKRVPSHGYNQGYGDYYGQKYGGFSNGYSQCYNDILHKNVSQ